MKKFLVLAVFVLLLAGIVQSTNASADDGICDNPICMRNSMCTYNPDGSLIVCVEITPATYEPIPTPTEPPIVTAEPTEEPTEATAEPVYIPERHYQPTRIFKR